MKFSHPNASRDFRVNNNRGNHLLLLAIKNFIIFSSEDRYDNSCLRLTISDLIFVGILQICWTDFQTFLSETVDCGYQTVCREKRHLAEEKDVTHLCCMPYKMRK